jgi:hypothetical protein
VQVVTDLYEQADLYCAAFSFPIDSEVEWLLAQVPGAGTRRVLEPFCGNARYARAFVDRGVEYWGVERSAAMLSLAERGERVHLIQDDARTLDIRGVQFDLAWCPINSIRHLLNDDDLIAHLQNVNRHLVRNGLYVVETDLTCRDGLAGKQPFESHQWSIDQPDGSVVACAWRVERYDLAGRRTFERAIVQRCRGGGVVEEASHLYEMRMLTFDELIQRGGFEAGLAFLHQSAVQRSPVDFSPALENIPYNCYFFLRPMTR